MFQPIKYIYLLAAILAMTALWGCEDDFDPGASGIMDGSMTTVPVVINFDTETAVQINSRGLSDQPGNAIQDLDNFWMVIYNQDGSLRGKYKIRENGVNRTPTGVSNVSYSSNSDNRLPGESNLGDNAAGKLKFDLELPSARYYIYGVANVNGFDSQDISTRDRLKSIRCPWDSTNIANNSEMFGIFSIGQHRDATDDEPIAVTIRNERVQQLHCWMRRLASKVTVSFDGSELFDNVYVFIDTVMVCDIPRQCSLGKPNHPGWINDQPDNVAPSRDRYNRADGVIYWGGVDQIQDLKSSDLNMLVPDNLYHVCNGHHTAGGPDNIPGVVVDNDKHAHTSRSLFFYENLQGTGKDKRQSYDDTSIAFPSPKPDDLTSGWKDHKSYGTYVEVRGYYYNRTPYGEVLSGWIKYRFMLGMDHLTDYNVFRNTHYKLTLKLRGNANDYDWHIDFRQEPGIVMTSPQYISYLYGKSMFATVKIVGEMKPGTKLEANILRTSSTTFTDWGPWGNGSTRFPDPSTKTYDGHPIFLNKNLDPLANGRHTSFLSLRKTNVLRLDPYPDRQSNVTPASDGLIYIENYYEKTRKEGSRTYEVDDAAIAADGTMANDGAYTMSVTQWRNENAGQKVATERIFRIPLYTRPKELVTNTGFTGNNPYIAYPRKMTVQFKATLRGNADEEFRDYTFNLEIIQVRRIVNPKGVWRKAGSSKPFHVTLMHLPEDGASDFVSFTSIGKWSAEIISESDPIITLSSTTLGSDQENIQTDVRRIEGEDECPVDFDINFKGAQSGYAIVRVRYHNYTCEHDIFCYQGMEPVELVPGSGVRWNHANVYSFASGNIAQYPKTPLQEGSMFRRGNNTAILPTDNPVYTFKKQTNPTLPVLTVGSSTSQNMTWDNIIAGGRTTKNRFYTWSIGNTNERVAKMEEDFYTITTKSTQLNFPIKKAYGILYGEGSGSVISNLNEAVGYDGEGLDNDGSSIDKGMLGVFVYNSTTARIMFLPLGKAAHGRRKGAVGWSPSPADGRGTLRYASRPVYWEPAQTPLFHDIYRRPGALYWAREFYDETKDTHTTGDDSYFKVEKSSAFDINFFTMGFEGYSNGAIDVRDPQYGNSSRRGQANRTAYNSDACFLRTVCY